MKQGKGLAVIACEIFADELGEVLQRNGLTQEITWVGAALHTDLSRLSERIKQSVSSDHQPICLLFGSGCLQGAGADSPGVRTLPVSNCIEALVGNGKKLALESQGCFILTPGWVRSWLYQFNRHILRACRTSSRRKCSEKKTDLIYISYDSSTACNNSKNNR